MSGQTQAPKPFGVLTDYEYRVSHKRDRLVVWSGPFLSRFEAVGLSLPAGNGYMLTTYKGDKVRVECPSPRDEENLDDVDVAVSLALKAHYRKSGTVQVGAPDTTEITIPASATNSAERCRGCDVSMTTEDCLAHRLLCVEDARATHNWLGARHGVPVFHPKPDRWLLRRTLVTVAVALFVLDVVMLTYAFIALDLFAPSNWPEWF
jgi:hypothetical protein